MKRGVLVAVAWLAGGTVALSAVPAASAGPVRVEVATLDGVPVYHWHAFDSTAPNDVDRALILREFPRRGYKLRSKLVDDAVQSAVAKDAGGNAGKFADELRQKGATMEDFRRFVSEEIMLGAMLHQEGPLTERRTKQEQWLAGLRTAAVVKRLPASEH